MSSSTYEQESGLVQQREQRAAHPARCARRPQRSEAGARVGGVPAGQGHDGEDQLPCVAWHDRADPGGDGGDHCGGDAVSRTDAPVNDTLAATNWLTGANPATRIRPRTNPSLVLLKQV